MPLAKAVKTERTHEENQERAYIAASRRSDRSLEARVESARRASALHKRRTGRALKVTEQDVVKEGVYKEEEDELPPPYGGLAAPLQTSSTGFDRTLPACCTNHVATKSDVDRPIHNPHILHSPKVPQYDYIPKSSSSSPMLMHQQRQQMSHQTPNSSNYQLSSYSALQPLQTDLSIQYDQHCSALLSIHQDLSPQGSPVMTGGHDRGPLPGLGHSDATILAESQALLSASNTMLERYPSLEDDSCVSPFQKSPVFISSGDTDIPSHYNFNLFSTPPHPESPVLLDSTFNFNGPLTSMSMASADISDTYNDMNSQLSSTTEIGIYHPYFSFDDLDSTITISPSDQNTWSLEDSGQNYNFFSSTGKGQVPDGTPGIGGENWNGLVDWEAWHPST